MLSKSLNAFAHAYNFVISETLAYGKIGRYMVTVFDEGGKKAAFISFFIPEDEGDESKELKRYKLTEDIKALSLPALSDCELYEGGIILRSSADLKSFDEALLALCGFLDETGFAGAESCSNCGAETESESSYVGVSKNRISLLCEECAREILHSQSDEEAEKNFKSKKRGVFAALTADIVVCALFVLLFVFAIPHFGIRDGKGETVVKALFFAIPFSAVMAFASFLSYRISTGRKGAERLLPCSCFSALFSVLMVYFASAAEYAKSFGLNFSGAFEMAGTSLKAPFTDPKVREDFQEYLLYCILAVVVVALIYSIALEDKSRLRCVLLKYGESERFTGFPEDEAAETAGEDEAAETAGEDEAAAGEDEAAAGEEEKAACEDPEGETGAAEAAESACECAAETAELPAEAPGEENEEPEEAGKSPEV